MPAKPFYLECPSNITDQEKLKILVLCTGNSARSIMAEALFNTIGSDHFVAWSAGSHPTGKVNPYALEKINSLGYNADALSSKSWLVFTHTKAPVIDVVLTVSGNAANEDCPVFPGNWTHIHWGLPDPATYMYSPILAQQAFDDCFDTLKRRIETVINQMNACIYCDPNDRNIVGEKQPKTLLIQKLKEHASNELIIL